MTCNMVSGIGRGTRDYASRKEMVVKKTILNDHVDAMYARVRLLVYQLILLSSPKSTT